MEPSGPACFPRTEHEMSLILVDLVTNRLREKLLKLVVHDDMYIQTPENKGRNSRVPLPKVFLPPSLKSLSL